MSHFAIESKKPKKVNGHITQEPEFEGVSMDEILTNKHKRLWIVGDPGSGKSTLLKRIAELTCRHSLSSALGQIPVLTKAVEIVSSLKSLEELLFEITETMTQSGKSAFGPDALGVGHVTVLIDAVDELGEDTRLQAFFERLTSFEKRYPKCPIIVTSRNYSYLTKAAPLGSFDRYNVSPISYKDANKILQNFGTTKKISADKSRELLRQLENIHGFDLNPLVVTIFAASADVSRKDIPCNISELFAKFIETMLGRWDSQKGLAQLYEAGLKSLLLQGIALRMHRAKEVRISSGKFRDLIIEELELLGVKSAKIDQLLDEITVRSGLLRVSDGYTEFTHLLIQEYFAGKALSDEPNLGLLATDEWWQRAIVFCCGSNPKDEARLLAIKDERLAGNDEQLFTLAVTLGLATQASYFVRVAPKCEIMDWVVQQLARSTQPLLSTTTSKYPIHVFLAAYLMGRDSVAAECMLELEQYAPEIDAKSGEAEFMREFWLIVGLMEGGNLDQAFVRIKKFHPSSPLPLLALHLGAFLITHVRSTSKSQKAVAKQLVEKLSPAVRPALKSYLKEFKSHLLEWRKGTVREIEMPPEDGGEPRAQ